jgi:RHS repeat-associated protein
MKAWREWFWAMVVATSLGVAGAQTPAPVLGNIEGPYAPIQSTVKIANTTWGAGSVAYGPSGAPLVISGSNLGGGGTVQFVPYKNGIVDTSVAPVQATVTLWTSNMLILTVPSGALSGLITVTVGAKTSNGLPFLVTPGTYAASCPAGPASTQLQIVTSSLHDGAVGQSYSATLHATGGGTPYSWSISSGTLPSGLSLNASTGTISGTPSATTGSNPALITFQVTDSGSPRQVDQAEMGLTVGPAQTMSSGTVYSYGVGYDGVGNVTSFQDNTYNSGPGVMGAWSMTAPGGGEGYDSLNRLMGASATWPDGTQQYLCWSYDAFGNRTQQEISGAAFQSGSGGANSCNPQSSSYLATAISSFNSNNQISSTNARGVTAIPGYDQAGNMLSDGVNSYLYDGEGRVCAVQSMPSPGVTSITGYLYDADGNRVAKGSLTNCSSLTSCSCDPTTNGFQFTENYVAGPGGEELSMLDGNNNWQRTNLYVGGRLIGTYDLVGNQPALHFHLEDALGTRRMQVSGMLANLGQPEMDYQSLPFGDQLAPIVDSHANQSAEDATPLHFTGKERDAESKNDYFGARYYASSMGRFLSPDWSAKVTPVPYAKLGDPQSLNLYSYVRNNPLTTIDPDGHCGPLDPYDCWMMIQWLGDAVVGGLQQYKRHVERTMTERSGLGPLKVAAEGYVLTTTLAMGADAPPEDMGVRTDVAEGGFAASEAGLAGRAAFRVVATGDIDADAVALAKSIGGKASVRIEGLTGSPAGREFDAVSDKFVAQTFSSRNAALKPNNFLSLSRRAQIRATLDAAKQTGKTAYFEFTGGTPDKTVTDFIQRNAERIGVNYEVH